jgi:hypothetical protein
MVLLSLGMPAGDGQAPPRWWAERGAPMLRQIQEETLHRRGAPYMHQRVYLDVKGYRRKVKPEGDLLDPLREGRVWIGVRDRFLVAVGKEARRDILARLLARSWQGPGPLAEDAVAQAFLDFSTRTIEEDTEVDYLYGPSGVMWVRYDAEAPRAFRSPALFHAMLALEFEVDPENQAGLDSIRSALKALRASPPP